MSSYEFYANALAIRVEVTKLTTGPSVPKSYRFVFSVPMASTARALVDHLTRADAYYPNSLENAVERKKMLTEAVADCRMIMQDLQCLREVCDQVKASRFERIAEMVGREIALVKGVRKNVHVMGRRQ